MRPHILYTTADTDRPRSICDARGEVCLSLCRVCRQGESELQDSCPGDSDLAEIHRICEEGTQAHGDEFYSLILERVALLEQRIILPVAGPDMSDRMVAIPIALIMALHGTPEQREEARLFFLNDPRAR